ncbi:MAG: M28 family peptidase [Planctomycetaceae bacterium]|nr:M28 family peptidase [Planctomycetaceae bacterium]
MHPVPRSTLRASVLLVGCLCAVAAVAAEKCSSYQTALESITATDLGQRVAHLADDSMEGRESGTRGGLAAAEYIAAQYQRLRLRPAGDDHKFFQSFAPNFRNVLAVIEGSDPKLRDEMIVVCAHYDHLGYGGLASLGDYGSIHPGADDNASGTAAVLQLARALTLLGNAPKRSILLANWDAEEKGLLGSRHWAAHPTVPLHRIVAAINVDMIGRLRDNRLTVFGGRSAYGWRRLVSSQNDQSQLKLNFSWSLVARADHYPLFEQGIPVLMFHTQLHEDYHRPSDTADRINSRGMEQITRLLFGVVYELARRSSVPAFRAAARHESPDTEEAVLGESAKPADRLGVSWTDDAAAVGGIYVSAVEAGSPADRAGVRDGDLIVRVADRDIRSDDDFFAAVSAADKPASITLRRPGQNQPLSLTVHFAGSPLRWGVVWRVDDAEPATVILTHVVPGSPAARAGLAAHDRVYQVDGHDFADEAAFALLAKTAPESLQLLVERDGRLRIATLRLRQPKPAKRAA